VRVVVLLAAAAAVSVQIPRDALLFVRLATPVSSHTAKPNDSVAAVVVAPVLVGRQVALEFGSAVNGRVKSVKRASDDERAELVLEFDEIVTERGVRIPIQSRLVNVDNARERVDRSGRIIGILRSETLAAQIDRGLEKLGAANAEVAGLLSAVRSVFIKDVDPEIVYPSGVEVMLVLEKPVKVNPEAEFRISNLEDDPELREIIQRQPIRTTAERPALPSDLINLMFLGSRDELELAFGEAGWIPASRLRADSVLETARAIIESRGYHEAPVTTLLLEGRRPDMVFQKMNNTFAMRHHVRVWSRPETYHGREIWVGASTHDIGIAFAADERSFFHTIDPEIDKERAKIVNDLTFTRQARLIGTAARADVPRETRNATGDLMITDGQIAVVGVNSRY
jgi:hypothetical protein